MSGRIVAAAVAAAAWATTAYAAEPAPRPADFQRLADCRKVAEPQARLACYDTAAEALEKAQSSGDIVVVDRAQADKVKQQAFGFTLPSLDIFNRASGRPEEALDRIQTTLKSGYQNRDGKWVLELADGAVWTQIDAEPLPNRARPGATVAIRRAALGSFFVNVGGQRAIRAVRSR